MADWQSVETAPKDRKVDLWAKRWDAATDAFEEQRFCDCSWWKADNMGAWDAHWSGLPKGWRATHWRERPEAPEGAPVRQ